MSSGILTSFVGALEASVAVLLTICCGVIATRLNLLKESSSKDISKLCVRLFLPALLISNLGSELHVATVMRYVPVLVWGLIYTLSSMALGCVLKRAFKFPAWTVPAICFNNTTALPLLLIQSLATAGILDDLFMSDTDTTSAALSRAKSYFLVNSMVGNSLTFAIGPKLLDDEATPDMEQEADSEDDDQYNGHPEGDEEYAHPTNSDGRTEQEQEEHETETSTLLPRTVANGTTKAASTTQKGWKKVPEGIRKPLATISSFANAPLIGAIIGVVLGLTPTLHRACFNAPSDGGFLKAWLMAAVKNVGELFAALQLIVVGAKLGGSIQKMEKGEASGTVPLIPVLSVLFIRFIAWPVISISLVFLVASKTNWLSPDPILWFVLCLMPTGPPAAKLTALADVSGTSIEEKMSIAKFVTISYAISPIVCLAVVGSLKATLAASG